jgi:ribA/ribD-fused uncharacterized protein
MADDTNRIGNRVSKTIDSFTGDYAFLSNFYACKVNFEGVQYPSTEHAFQAAKTHDVGERLAIRDARSAGHAKKLGRNVLLRTDWGSAKMDIMRTVLHEKFKDPMLLVLLMDTGKAKLVEGNHWGDTWWGVCKGKGKNNLGILLMELRQSFFDASDIPESGIRTEPPTKEKLKKIREVIQPLASAFYNDAPDNMIVPKAQLAALYTLWVNNKNWE